MADRINPFDAARVLEDEVFKKGVLILRERYKEQWALSPKLEDREKYYQKVLLLSEVINELKLAITNNN